MHRSARLYAFAVPIKLLINNRREDDFTSGTVVLVAGELCNTVQDAFVIAVEQQARERLQRLSALKRITPVDITQLSIKVHKIFDCCLFLF